MKNIWHKVWASMAIGMVVLPSAHAAAYPDRPIRLVVPQPPGGANDNLARIIGDGFSAKSKQPIVVENRPGAGITVGTTFASRQPADGYNLLMVNSIMLSASPSLYKNLPYDPVKDFVPVATLGVAPYVLVVTDKFPAHNLKEFLDMVKAKPGQYNYSSSGIGSTPHLITELLRSSTGINVTHVPYKGGGPSVTGLLGGDVAFTIESISTVAPYIRSGKMHALAVTSAQRLPQFPDVPTMIEAGVPGFEVTAAYGLVAPKGTPKEDVDYLSQHVAAVVKSQKVGDLFSEQGVQPVVWPPAQLGQKISDEVTNWSKLIKEANIKPE